MEEDINQANKKLEWYEKKYGPYIEKRGLSNWKNLFRKPTMNEIIILILLVMAIFLAFAYQHDTQICRDYVANFTQNYQHFGGNYQTNGSVSNYSNLTGIDIKVVIGNEG